LHCNQIQHHASTSSDTRQHIKVVNWESIFLAQTKHGSVDCTLLHFTMTLKCEEVPVSETMPLSRALLLLSMSFVRSMTFALGPRCSWYHCVATLIATTKR
jgi:hypothetical protein